MLVEHSRDIVLCCRLAAYMLAFGSRILHAASHSCADDRKLKLGKHSADLYEGLRHRIDLTSAAIYRDRADDLKAHALLLDRIDNAAQLKRRTRKSAYLSADDR